MLIRNALVRDLPALLAIEQASFGVSQWSEEEFRRLLARRTIWGQVCTEQERILGYSVFEVPTPPAGEPGSFELLSIAVHPACRRLGVGRELVGRLRRRLNERRPLLRTLVRETNLDAQLFFRAVGFLATEVLRRFDDDGRDAYVMELREENAAANLQPAARNA